MGGVESMTAAAVAALLGGMWAKGLPQTQRNLLIEQQVKAIYSLSSNLLIAQSTHLNLLIYSSTHCATYSLSSR